MAIWRSLELEALVGGPLDASGITAAAIDRVVTEHARESEVLDFKQSLWPKSPKPRPPWTPEQEFAKDVGALANHRGGLLLVGIAETAGAATASKAFALASDPDSEERRLRQALVNNLAPPASCDFIWVEESTGHWYCAVVVPPSTRSPHAVVIEGGTGLRYPMRRGSETTWLTASEVAERSSLTPSAASRGLGPRPDRRAGALWVPSVVGDLADRDMAEAARLAEHLGRWVELLADDDLRLAEAEATRNALDAELRLAIPRRGMLRAIVQAALDMMRAEVDELAASVGELIGEPLDSDRSIVPKAPPIGVPIAEPDPGADEQWQAVSVHVSELAEAAAEELPTDELPTGPNAEGRPDVEPPAPGRGTVIVTLLKWVAKESAAGVVRVSAVAAAGGGVAGSAWLANHGPSGVAKVVESLLNLVGI